MTKRRVFDIDFPETDDPAGVPPAPSPEHRRGPMAAAIAENAEALEERQTAEASIRAENDRLAHEFVRLKSLGLVVDRIPVDKVRAEKLVRDRKIERDPEIDSLKASIRAVGLSNPIRVEEAADGYELIQGFRRLTAYRELLEETGDDIYATIPAGLVARGQTLDALYRRMVDENLVRRDISFSEMAQLAWSYLHDHRQTMENVHEAVETLYASASRQKRGHIRVFAGLIGALGDHLRFAEALPRALGTDLARKIDEEDGFLSDLIAALRADPATTPEDELTLLRAFAERRPVKRPARTEARATAKTTFKLSRPEGPAKCTVAQGRVDLRLDRDFTAIERDRLEAAVLAFFETLDA